MEDIGIQLKEFILKYNEYKLSINKNEYELYGTLIVNDSYKNIPIYDEYNVRILINKNYPYVLPKVYELSNRITNEYSHINSDNSLCLGTNIDLYDFLNSNSKFEDFYLKIIRVVFYGISYNNKYGILPFGERSHGNKGVIESYKEKFGVKDIEEFKTIAELFVTKNEQKILKNYEAYVKLKRIEGYYMLCKFKPYIDDFSSIK